MCGLTVSTSYLFQYNDLVLVCVWQLYTRCVAIHSPTWSNSSRSTSPSPFRSNILKAISKFLWGAGHKKEIQKSVQHNMKTTCHTESTQFNTEWAITYKLCNIFSFYLNPPVVQHRVIQMLFFEPIQIKLGKLFTMRFPNICHTTSIASEPITTLQQEAAEQIWFFLDSRVQWGEKRYFYAWWLNGIDFQYLWNSLKQIEVLHRQ